MNREWEMLDPAVMGDEERMHGLFRYLRENAPVCRVEHPDFDPFWAVTRYKDTKAGQNLGFWYPVAKLDSDAIEDPDTFNIEHDNRIQLAFG